MAVSDAAPARSTGPCVITYILQGICASFIFGICCSISMRRLQQVVATLRPGIPYAFCIGSVVFSLLTATNLVTGAAPRHMRFCSAGC